MPRLFMFDAYGTLFDVHSAVMRAGGALGAQAEAFSRLWRAKQLEYTWIYSGMRRGADHDFAVLTARALDFCLAHHQISDPALRAALLNAYQTLDAYPDVRAALEDLRAGGNATAIFTNGTRAMMDKAIAAAGLGGLIDTIATVEGTNAYKPDPHVYSEAMKAVNLHLPAEIIFVSSNRWDVAGAASFGFTPVWCNRTGQPDEYPEQAPVATITTLAALGGL